MKKIPANPTGNKIFEDAAKKLKKIEESRNQAEKYFKEREMAENKLKLLESNLKKKVKLEKRASLGLEEKTVEKVETLLKSILNFDSQILNKLDGKLGEKTSECIQTEREETATLVEKINLLEKENEKLRTKKNELKKDKELLKSELENVKSFNEKVAKENKLLQTNLEEARKLKNEVELKAKDVQKENQNLIEAAQKNTKILKEYEELKQLLEEKALTENESTVINNKKKEIVRNKGNKLELLFVFDFYEPLISYLKPVEISNLKSSNKYIYDKIDNSLFCIRHSDNILLSSMRRKLSQTGSLDIKKEYLVNDSEIERLMKDYVKGNKLSGKDLRNSIVRAVSFMNKDVKGPLGIKVTSSNIATPKSGTPGTGSSSLLGGIGSMLGGMFYNKGNPSPLPQDKRSNVQSQISTPKGLQSLGGSGESSRAMSIHLPADASIEIEKYDKFLISDHLTQVEHYDFDYSSPEEIKNILNRFLKSNFSTEKLTGFIKEVCFEYSELLFFANKAIHELRELEVVKNALNERFRRYHQLSTVYEKEVNSLKISKKFSSNEIKLDSSKVEHLENQYSATLNEVTNLRAQLEASQKKAQMLKIREESVSSHYESFKVIYGKELTLTRFDLQEITKERNALRNVLIELKSFFNDILASQRLNYL